MEMTIFTAGSKRVGLGHLTRMRTLTTRLSWNTRVITTTPDTAVLVFAGTEAEIVPLKEGGELSKEIIEHSRGTSVLVLDPPYLPDDLDGCTGPAWQLVADLARERGIPVVRFTDEETPSRHSCDLLINDHPMASGFAADYGSLGGADHVLAGPRYFLIDPCHERATAKDGGLVVSFGGSDHNDIVQRLAPALAELSATLPVHVVLGVVSGLDVADLPGLTVSKSLPPEVFAATIKGARLALTASGNTLFERVFHGVPGLSLAQFPRQHLIGKGFEELGLTRHLGLGLELNASKLTREIIDFVEDGEAMKTQMLACKALDVLKGGHEILSAIAGMVNADMKFSAP
ncbi:MAG TPA: hypothetical protein QF509_06585 [Rhodospirillales bacterium]|jgi:spore coat polysaccharide biosynthesis predicted glycosyltransferase SpsG|nr:hypothetical protein [Rhodospirillales bacterium]